MIMDAIFFTQKNYRETINPDVNKRLTHTSDETSPVEYPDCCETRTSFCKRVQRNAMASASSRISLVHFLLRSAALCYPTGHDWKRSWPMTFRNHRLAKTIRGTSGQKLAVRTLGGFFVWKMRGSIFCWWKVEKYYVVFGKSKGDINLSLSWYYVRIGKNWLNV